jgi:Flp pilus assembly protein TadG
MTRRKQRGGTLVEAALVLLLFVTFLMAIVEFGRAYSIYQTVTNAAREGAHFAVAPCSALATAADCTYFGNSGKVPLKADIQAKVSTYLKALNLDPNDVNTQVYVCSQNDTTDCSTLPQPSGYLPCTPDRNYCTHVNGKDIYFTAVKIKAPYQFILSPFRVFGDSNGRLFINSEARMRDEAN